MGPVDDCCIGWSVVADARCRTVRIKLVINRSSFQRKLSVTLDTSWKSIACKTALVLCADEPKLRDTFELMFHHYPNHARFCTFTLLVHMPNLAIQTFLPFGPSDSNGKG